MSEFLDALLGGVQWYRRRRGGHWERWSVETAAAIGAPQIWIRTPWCTQADTDLESYSKFRYANPSLRGTPTCEDHRS